MPMVKDSIVWYTMTMDETFCDFMMVVLAEGSAGRESRLLPRRCSRP